MTRLRVLHVIESFGGGAATAVLQYVDSTPRFEHVILRATREGDYVPDPRAGATAATVRALPRHPLAAIRSIKAAVREFHPNIVHAHSSYAGLYVRVALRSRPDRPTVYTPHGFSFERRDVGKLRRGLFWLVERALGFNTSVIAGCSPREVRLAKTLGTRNGAVLVPNHSDDAPTLVSDDRHDQRSSTPMIAAGGRISVVKDPAFFVQMVHELRPLVSEFTAIWVGGGEESEERQLEAEGLRVVGWQSRSATLTSLSHADVYVHSSRWEGFPLAVLEAARLRIPIVVRDIDAFSEAPAAVKGRDPYQVAKKVSTILEDESAREENLALWSDFLAAFTGPAQRKALEGLYAGLLEIQVEGDEPTQTLESMAPLGRSGSAEFTNDRGGLGK